LKISLSGAVEVVQLKAKLFGEFRVGVEKRPYSAVFVFGLLIPSVGSPLRSSRK
jgi:hypothetical protein